MPKLGGEPGHHSTGQKPYAPRPRKATKASAKKAPARKAKPSPLIESVEQLDPDRRSTAQERRRVIVEALRLASRIADDPVMPPSTRTQALTQLRGLSAQLVAIDEADPATPSAWASRAPKPI